MRVITRSPARTILVGNQCRLALPSYSSSLHKILQQFFHTSGNPTMENIQLFNKYPFGDVVVPDETLAPYMNVSKPGIVPHAPTKLTLGRFGKARIPLTERFVSRLMYPGKNTGKKRLAIRVFKEACDIMHRITGENPMQLLVNAVMNAGPRETSSKVGRGGSTRRSSVDVSPYRRISIAIKLIIEGIRQAAFKDNNKKLQDVMAHEIINAARNNQNSYAVKKKEEIERIGKSNR